MAKKGFGLDMPGVDVAATLAEKAAAAAAPEEKNEKVVAAAPAAGEVKPVVKEKVNAKANVKVKKKEESTASLLQARAAKETKGVAMNLRVKPSVKERFEVLRTKLNYSQSDFFEVLVQLAEDTLEKQKK